MIIRYEMPRHWISYDQTAILQELMDAKASIMALTQIPYQRSWADEKDNASVISQCRIMTFQNLKPF